MPYMVKGKKCVTGACGGPALVAGRPMKRFGMALGSAVKTTSAFRVGRTATDPCCDYPQQPCCNDRSSRYRSSVDGMGGVGAQMQTATFGPQLDPNGPGLFDYAKDILQSVTGTVAQSVATVGSVVSPPAPAVKPPMTTTTKIAIAGGVTLGAIVLLKLLKK